MRTFIKIAAAIVLVLLLIFPVKNYFLINKTLEFQYPLNDALFPRDFASPTFYWQDKSNISGSWKLYINLKNKKSFVETVNEPYWKPRRSMWDSLKQLSEFKDIDIQVFRKESNFLWLSPKGRVKFRVSEDSVGGLIMYRQIPLPFTFAEQNIELTSYSSYNVESEEPCHNILERFKACGNCHSTSADGKTIGLDFDAVSRDKGGYFIANLDTITHFNKENYMSWSKLQGKSTFGLFSKVSPSGRYVVTTVKDRVIQKKFEELSKIAYSQFFVPVNGVLGVYDTKTKKFFELPGANDMNYVQTNAIWTPDEKYLIFARAKALPYPDQNSNYSSFFITDSLINDFVNEKREFKFDLYKIPFNDGKGGIAEPIKGASANDKSNYFPAISRDGKWLIFCQAKNNMMLRPDSRLYILPMNGNGKAKKMKCNFNSMNSWHSISPNSKWVVFVSKVLGDYSDLFLTHIDENGNSSVPIWLPKSKKPGCATNYPEFVNRDPNFKIVMKYDYINLYDIDLALALNEKEKAKKLLQTYIEQGLIGAPIEYREIAEYEEKLGEKAEAMKYKTLANKLDSTFNRGFKMK